MKAPILRDVVEDWRIALAIAFSGKKSELSTTLFGVAWLIGAPLLQMFVYYFLLAVVFRIREEGMAFALLIGITLHRYVMSTLNGGVGALLRGKGLLLSGILPKKRVWIYSSFLGVAIDLLIGLALVMVAGGVLGYIKYDMTMLWLIPILGLLLIFGLSNFLFWSCLGVYIRDFGKVFTLMPGFFLAIHPVLYNVDRIPEDYRALYLMNPVAALFSMFKGVLLGVEIPDFPLLGQTMIIVFIFSLLSALVFARLKGKVVRYW